MPVMNSFIARFSIAAALTAFAFALPAAANITVPVGGPPSQAAPWQLNTPEGETVKFPEDAQGRPTVLLFWPSWCPYSRALQPYVQDIWEDYRQVANVWTINILENGDPVKTMQERDLSFPLLLKGDALRKPYRITRTPWLVVIDANSRIVYTRPGNPPTPITVAKAAREHLNSLLGPDAVALPQSYPEPYTLHLKSRKRSTRVAKPKPPAPSPEQWQAWLEQYIASIDSATPVSDEPARGAVADGKTAIKIAREIWTERYGRDLMVAQAPHRSYRKNNIWVVVGTTDSGEIGAGLLLAITADEGQILQVTSGESDRQ